MLTDDSNVLLILQLMESNLIECLFLHVSEMRQMDAPKHLHGFLAKGTMCFGRENAVGKSYFFSSVPSPAEIRMHLRVAPFNSLEGFSYFQVFWLHQLFDCIFYRWRFCEAFIYRVFTSSHHIPIYWTFLLNDTQRITRGLSPFTHLSSVSAVAEAIKIYYTN